MALHIRQKNSSLDDTKTYIVVNSKGYEADLSQHPCMIERPDMFEIVDIPIPDDAVYLNFSA